MKKIQVQLTDKINERLKIFLVMHDRKISEVVQIAIDEYLAREIKRKYMKESQQWRTKK